MPINAPESCYETEPRVPTLLHRCVGCGVFVLAIPFGIFTNILSVIMLSTGGWDGIKHNCNIVLRNALIVYNCIVVFLMYFNLKLKPSLTTNRNTKKILHKARLLSSVNYIFYCIAECFLILLYFIYIKENTCFEYLKPNDRLLSPGNIFIYQIALGGFGILTSITVFVLSLDKYYNTT